MTRILFTSLLALPLFAQQAPDNPDWHKPFPPFRIIANIYWVGTYDLSSYLITTPEGIFSSTAVSQIPFR